MDRFLKTAWIVAVVVGAAGCSSDGDDEGSVDQAQRTRWELPDDVRRVAQNTSIPYEGAPAWDPRRCGGKLLAGTSTVGQYVMDKFEIVRSIGGYACRQNTANGSQMSVHGTGRALDIFIPLRQGRANSEAGDPVANWLVKNAADIGIQLVIWNRSVWQSNGRAEKAYSGPHPHHDHIHVELTTRASKKLTPFFNRLEDEGDEDAGITTDEPNADAGGNPVPTADASTTADATTTKIDAAAPPPAADAAPLPPPPPVEEDDHDHDDNHREYNEDLDSDNEPGEQDSLGTGLRDAPSYSSAPSPSESTSGCAAAPGSTSRSSGLAGGLALALAITLVRRRRR